MQYDAGIKWTLAGYWVVKGFIFRIGANRLRHKYVT